MTFALTLSHCNPDRDVKTATCLKIPGESRQRSLHPRGDLDNLTLSPPKASSSFNKLSFSFQKVTQVCVGWSPGHPGLFGKIYLDRGVFVEATRKREGSEPRYCCSLGSGKGGKLRPSPYHCLASQRRQEGRKEMAQNPQTQRSWEDNRLYLNTE